MSEHHSHIHRHDPTAQSPHSAHTAHGDHAAHGNHTAHGAHGAQSGRNLAVAFLLNLSFCLIELIGGLLTNSVAILSDAVHDLGDSISLGMAWYMQRFSRRKATQTYSYGYKRFALLSALLNSVILFSGSIFVLIESSKRFFEPAETHAQGMFLLAILGVAVNGYAVLRLKKGSSLNERVVSLHLLEDVLGWIAVLIGSVLMWIFNWTIIDPILSVGIAVYILLHVYRNFKEVFRIFLQGTPEHVDVEKVRQQLLSLPPVKGIHDLHVWSMDGEYVVLTVHLVVSKTLTSEERVALRSETRSLLSTLGIDHPTIEVESEVESEGCVFSC
ncbi:MAG: cation diffusion facilitator family transporter [Bacteroidales bacterium]|nr:cation diffusion facilitator family transporter [Bacteroidales bacterium]